MSSRKSPTERRLTQITIRHGHPPISFADLALMLEIDLAMGHKKDFEIRLQRALHDAYRQGKFSRSTND